jgi:vesicle transport through interaction with t-SNAREs 1
MQGTESLYRASDSLARSHQVAVETDQIGNEIIGELDTQRESLLRTRERVSKQVDTVQVCGVILVLAMLVS